MNLIFSNFINKNKVYITLLVFFSKNVSKRLQFFYDSKILKRNKKFEKNKENKIYLYFILYFKVKFSKDATRCPTSLSDEKNRNSR